MTKKLLATRKYAPNQTNLIEWSYVLLGYKIEEEIIDDLHHTDDEHLTQQKQAVEFTQQSTHLNTDTFPVTSFHSDVIAAVNN